MSRIGATLSGFEVQLLNQLTEARTAATINALRLATGKKINSPKDNPTDFVNLSGFESRLANVQQTAKNVTVASSIVSQAQLASDQIRTQLGVIRAALLTDEDQALSAEARLAAQVQIDAAIDAIDVLANTDIDGKRVLNGSVAFRTSGLNTSEVISLEIQRARQAVAGGTSTISGTVTVAATKATFTHAEGGATIGNDADITITGKRGQATVQVLASENLSLADFATRVNNESHKTGVVATVDGTDIDFTSVDFGSASQVTIALNSGTFSTGTDNGSDAQATFGGVTRTAVGNRFTVADNDVTFALEIADGFTGDIDVISVTGDALTFALSTDITRRSTLAVDSVHSSHLGGLSGRLSDLRTGGSAAGLNTNTANAIRIVDEALGDLDVVDGSIDGFANAAISSAAALTAATETDLTASIAKINTVNTEEETILLAKNQALVSNAIASFAILDEQRSTIVNLIQQIAGLKQT